MGESLEYLQLFSPHWLSIWIATAEVVTLNPPHKPHPNAIQAFDKILPTIKSEIIKSRHQWNKHEPKMWSRAQGISDQEITNFTIENELVLVSGAVSVTLCVLVDPVYCSDSERFHILWNGYHRQDSSSCCERCRRRWISSCQNSRSSQSRMLRQLWLCSTQLDWQWLQDTHEILFHSLFHEEVRPNPEDPPTDWRAIHTEDKPLEFFNEWTNYEFKEVYTRMYFYRNYVAFSQLREESIHLWTLPHILFTGMELYMKGYLTW